MRGKSGARAIRAISIRAMAHGALVALFVASIGVMGACACPEADALESHSGPAISVTARLHCCCIGETSRDMDCCACEVSCLSVLKPLAAVQSGRVVLDPVPGACAEPLFKAPDSSAPPVSSALARSRPLPGLPAYIAHSSWLC